MTPPLMPCNNRPQKRGKKLCEITISPTLTTNIRPLTIIIVLRPSQSASSPATTEESMLPPMTAATMIDV